MSTDKNTNQDNNQDITPDSNNKTAKKSSTGKAKITGRVISMLVLIFVLIGLYWVVKSYFDIGNKKYTNAAQIETYVNPINTRVSAYIKEIRYQEHQHVKKGDTLLILDDREILTQLGQAEAAYMAALASKISSESSVKTVANN